MARLYSFEAAQGLSRLLTGPLQPAEACVMGRYDSCVLGDPSKIATIVPTSLYDRGCTTLLVSLARLSLAGSIAAFHVYVFEKNQPASGCSVLLAKSHWTQERCTGYLHSGLSPLLVPLSNYTGLGSLVKELAQ